MANANKHKMGPGTQGKSSGTGAMTDLPEGILPENMVLSNRDKAQHSDERGLDSKNVQTEQYQDHVGNRLADDVGAAATGGDNVSGSTSPMTDTSGDASSLTRQQNG